MLVDPVVERFLSRLKDLQLSQWELVTREHRREYGLRPRGWFTHVRRARARTAVIRVSKKNEQNYAAVVSALHDAVSEGKIPDARIDGALGAAAAAAGALAVRAHIPTGYLAALYEPFEGVIPLSSIIGQ